ncbi:MAG TPA: hypothetical protein VJZ71_01265 [Phycisphaerae bacterium]|nr:hypothetical protein [Phycisphaerae bacterium]
MPRKTRTGLSPSADVIPAGLPTDPRGFWRASSNLAMLRPPDDVDRTPTLKRLGPLPFSGSGFPLMGFLATLFEHVANSAREEVMPDEHSAINE